MSANQTPGAPTEQEWRSAVTAFVCNVSNLPTPLQSPALGLDMSPLINGVLRALRPLIAREREAAKAEGMAAVAVPVLAVAEEWEADEIEELWVRAADVRAAIPTDATEALARLKAEWQAEALRKAAEVLDDHTDCDCEPGDHLTRVAGSKWLRARAARVAQQDGGDRD